MRAIETKVWACGVCGTEANDYAYAELCCSCRYCGKQTEPKSGRVCDPCHQARLAQYLADERAKHAKLTPVAAWDYALGDGPEDVISDGYHAIDVAREHLENDGIERPSREQIQAEIESWMLVPAQPGTLPEFDVVDFLSEHMPEEWDGSYEEALKAAEATLNKAIRELNGTPLVPIKGQRVDVDALMNECWKGVP